MLPPLAHLLLTQLEHVDLSHALEHLLGTGGSAVVLGLVVRQWVGGKLRELAVLKRARQEDRLWKAMARQRLEAQGSEIDRLARNLHHLRNWCTTVAADMHVMGRRLELELADHGQPRWDVTQLPVAELPAEIIESKSDDEEPS